MKGGNQKRGAKFGTFLKILDIKKRLNIIGTRLYIIRMFQIMRNRSKASGKGKGAGVAHSERGRRGDVRRNICPRNTMSLTRFRQESSLPSSSHESVNTHGRISSSTAMMWPMLTMKTLNLPFKKSVINHSYELMIMHLVHCLYSKLVQILYSTSLHATWMA